MTEGMQICLPTTCKLLRTPAMHLRQAVKAAFWCKDKAATKTLSTVSEAKYLGSKFK